MAFASFILPAIPMLMVLATYASRVTVDLDGETQEVVRSPLVDLTDLFQPSDKEVTLGDGVTYFCCCNLDQTEMIVKCTLRNTQASKKKFFKKGCGGIMGATWHSWITMASHPSHKRQPNAGRCMVPADHVPAVLATRVRPVIGSSQDLRGREEQTMFHYTSGIESVAELRAKIEILETQAHAGCESKCGNANLVGRWHEGRSFGHHCWSRSVAGQLTHSCVCSDSEEPPPECHVGHSSFAEGEHAQHAQRQVHGMRSKTGSQDGTSSLGAIEVTSQGSPQETVNNFCSKDELIKMRGHGAVVQAPSEGLSGAAQLESHILADILQELEGNNIDKMAKEIFTFYVCTRWIPDELFFELAEKEMTMELVTSIVDAKESRAQAVSELYQKYKFMPMLCSKNLQVFEKTSSGPNSDGTYFQEFEMKVNQTIKWLDQQKDSPVSKGLEEIDGIFCGPGKSMNSCRDEGLFRGFFGSSGSPETKWEAMAQKFKDFQPASTQVSEWDRNLLEWKSMFPFHTFVDFPDGMASQHAPKPNERFLICFGKRVASEMHRRPRGNHILTDQNTAGCHGWWSVPETLDMMRRMVKLWRPPTCQLADMAYTMKREILKMTVAMNERLFDAIPSLLMDEELDKTNLQESLAEIMDSPEPQEHKSGLVEGMRVSSVAKTLYSGGRDNMASVVPAGKVGTVHVDGSHVFVYWDPFQGIQKEDCMIACDVSEDDLMNWMGKTPVQDTTALKILPSRWKSKKNFMGRMKDLVAGLASIADGATQIFNKIMKAQGKQTGLAEMMSQSVSKWVVCPVAAGASLGELDNHLGVEDAAFQDFKKEAYAKWTGYEAKVPGEVCVTPDFLPPAFRETTICEISVLLADHVEKYTTGQGTPANFICPIKPPLPFEGQLAVLADKKGMCYLRMTEKQAARNQWKYQGKFPARLQHERMPNEARPEYELIKLMNVPAGKNKGNEDLIASFGRFCSLEEYLDNSRFCELPELFNLWSTMEDMAGHLADTVAGALGVSATALQGALAAFQQRITQDRVKTAALQVGEKAMDKLFGVGRLVGSGTKMAKAYLDDDLKGKGRRKDRLQEDLFGELEGGTLLHRMSFQRSLSDNGLTSNAKERFQRYVVAVPCPNFDPALIFSVRREWGTVARRIIAEADAFSLNVQKGAREILSYPRFRALVRGEGYLIEDTKKKHVENKTRWEAAASMQVPSVDATPSKRPVECSVSGITSCNHPDSCVRTWSGCVPKTTFNPDAWKLVTDGLLSKVVGGLSFTNNAEKLYGIEMNLYCAEKRLFDRVGPPENEKAESLRECLERGIAQNAALHAKEPWRLYFPEEVVVLATFDEINVRECEVDPSSMGRADMESRVCPSGALRSQDNSLRQHLPKGVPKGIDSAQFRGIQTGAGYPQGAPLEVPLRPEDILEAVNTPWLL